MATFRAMTAEEAGVEEMRELDGDEAAAAAADDDDMTPEERLAYLTQRGVTVETAEDRKKKQEVVPLRGAGDFCFLKIPHTPALEITRHHGPVSKGDTLLTLLKAGFADGAALDPRTVERETADKIQRMAASMSVQAPKLETMQGMAGDAGVEAYPLARGNAANGWRHVNLYIDEIGALRQRPRNARAEKLCAAAGLHNLSIHGDAYVGRTQSAPEGLRNADFYESELEPDAQWVLDARRSHAEQYAALPSHKPKSGAGMHFSWSQTDDEVEVEVTVPPECDGEGPLKKRTTVKYGKGDALYVTVDGKDLVRLKPLFGNIDPGGCSWTCEGREIIITMEKREAREWHTIQLARAA